MASTTQDYAATAYAATQTRAMTPLQAFLELYDIAIAACVAGDARKASAALVELIAALDFEYEEIAGGFYRLYEYALREVKAGRFEPALKILNELRDTWRIALARSSGTPDAA
jgi:flagellin-specific chaperone FliS